MRGGVGIVLLLFVILFCGQTASADYTMKVNARSNRGEWEGFGVCLAWWANVFGNRIDVAQAVFSLNYVQLPELTVRVPGLGLQYVRYNLGGCGEGMDKDDVFQPHKQMKGFWLNWYNSSADSASWDWEQDSKQRRMLWLSKLYGAKVFEMWSDAPMWWMNTNHKANGAPGNCLTSWNEQQFAYYIATVARYFRDKRGINFKYVEPFNEPNAGWWNGPGEQEGCNFDHPIQARVLKNLREELDKAGLWTTLIAASDENNMDTALDTWKSLKDVYYTIGKVNVHGYFGVEAYRGKTRPLLRTAVKAVSGTKIGQSEYGDWDPTGMRLVDTISRDLNELQPSSWVYWQALSGGNWGLIDADEAKGIVRGDTMKYYMFAQYTRHIRTGMIMLDSRDRNTVAAYDRRKNLLVLVTVNFNIPARYIGYDLSGFSSVRGPVTRWMTNSNGKGDRYRQYSNDTFLAEKRCWSWFPSNTVQTLEVQNVLI